MASCSQVDSFLQAHVDGELEPSEEHILLAHLGGCRACREEVSALEAFSQELIAASSMHRLRGSLRARVLAHLPEMEVPPNHSSHPTDPGVTQPRYGFRIPVALAACAAVVIVSILAFFSFGGGAQPGEAIGAVTYVSGSGAMQRHAAATRFGKTSLKAQVSVGEEFETLDDTRLALSLSGNSSLKLNANTHLSIRDSRNVFVYRGQAFFDVGRDRRHFYVNTPSGEILVFGTSFLVDVAQDATTVMVLEGDVLVSTPEGRSALSNGRQSTLRIDAVPTDPVAISDNRALAWLQSITPDANALARFQNNLDDTSSRAVPVEAVYAVRNLRDRTLDGIQLSWDFDGLEQGHCGYFVHVTDSNDNLLFLDTVAGSMFDDAAQSYINVTPMEEPLTGVSTIHIRLIPDYVSGEIESSFRVNAIVR